MTGEPRGRLTEDHDVEPAAGDLVEEDLVEEVTIDGMCGVY